MTCLAGILLRKYISNKVDPAFPICDILRFDLVKHLLGINAEKHFNNTQKDLEDLWQLSR